MRKSVLFVFFLITTVNVLAQKPSGVWFAGSNLRIDKSAGVDEYKVDSIFGVEGSIIDFVSNKNFIIKGIGGSKIQGTYQQFKDTLQFNVDEYRWYGVVKDEELKLTMIDSSDYVLEMFYKKLKPSKISKSKILDSLSVKNSFWSLSLSTGAIGLSLFQRDTADVIDKPRAFISEFLNHRTHTEKGNYLVDSYKNYMFLYLFGKTTLFENLVLLNDFSAGQYSGKLYDSDNLWVTDNKIGKVVLKEVPVLSDLNHKDLISKMLGRYQLKLLDLSHLDLTEEVKTIISYFELQENNLCKIEVFISEDKEGVSVIRKLEKSGVWEVNPSGQYVTVTFDDERLSYVTFKKNSDYTEFLLDKNPWRDENSFNMELKFKKQ